MRSQSIRFWAAWLCVFVTGISFGADYILTTADGQGADTYLDYWNQNTNRGGQTALKISKNYVPYLKFDLSGITLETVTSATLSLYGPPDSNELPEPYPPYDTDFVIYGLNDGSDGWSETTITYTNAPLVSNPVTQHPYLVKLGTIEYTVGDKSAISMSPEGDNFIDFLNDRGPDGLVTIIIASTKYTAGYFFATKEMYGDGSEAPFIELTTESLVVPYNNWTGSTSNDWNTAGNWINELAGPDLPNSNDIAVLDTGSNYPVVIDANAFARELYIHGDGLDLLDQTLYLNSGILRIEDGQRLYMKDISQMIVEGDYSLLMDAYFGDDKIQCMPGKEIYSEWIDPNIPGHPGYTQVRVRKEIPTLQWQVNILSATGPTGTGGYSAQYCVDESGLTGSMHAPYAAYNSYYGRQLGPIAEPTVEIQFDKAYFLTEMWVWNYEDTYNGYGFRKVEVKYSTNGVDYTPLLVDSEPNFILAQGNADGSKSDVIDFGGAQAQYVRIKALGGIGTGNYEWRSSYGNYILKELRFYYDEPRARNPYPADNSEVDIDTDLSWIPGSGAVTGQDVWLGNTEATMVKIADNIAADAYELDITILDDNENYVWRVDGLDSGGSPTFGQLWSFTTRGRLSYPDGGIILATEYVTGEDWNPVTYGARRTVDKSGMTANTHSNGVAGTYWYARCPSSDPEPWAWFTFDNTYYLDEMWVWNCDAADPTDSDRALKRVRIEYSSLDDPDITNPADWTILMDGANPYFEWTKSVDGQKSDTVVFDDATARHLKITPIGGKGVGNYGSIWGYLLNELRIYHNGIWINPQATAPSPSDEAEVDIFLELGWTPGGGAVTGQDVWLAKVGDPLVKVGDNLDPNATSLVLDRLDNLEEYRWRVDGLDSGGSTTTGVEWTFSTRARLRWNPGGIGIIWAYGSPGNGGTTGDRAVNESGINGDLHDSFQWSNGWYCKKPWEIGITEPNLLIVFDRPYAITDMWVWNHDGTSTDEAAIAMKTVKVEYSTDGENYTTVMNGGSETFILPHGNTDGTHDTVINFGEAEAQYIRFTAVGGPGVGNYGSTEWGYKLRELRFYYIVPLWADLDYDGDVDIMDLQILALHLLENNWVSDPEPYCSGKPIGDINGDCFVDLGDLEEMSLEWLVSIP